MFDSVAGALQLRLAADSAVYTSRNAPSYGKEQEEIIYTPVLTH